jgi:DNA mismatch repair protein MutS
MVTGPNMGGKSTYLRQVALISLLAQCGSFVPATAARLMLVDRIFTRIGAGDNVAQGKSTFLIEMEEAATICTQATAASLVILDEVGRGTSTEDGKALAQAIIEYLVQTVGCLTLFATHYHELTHLAYDMPAIANYHMVCVKQGEVLHFLHRIEAGVAQASFGIEVAQLAALPAAIIKRARELVAL